MTFSTMTRVSLCAALVGGLALVGCGGDSTATDMGGGADGGTDGGGPTDGGGIDAGGRDAGPTVCPMSAPAPMNQMGACCYRASNATRQTMPNFRLSALKLTAPMGTLSSLLIRNLLQDGIDKETFNWLVQLSGVPATGAGALMIRTGYGDHATGGTGHFHFVSGIAPAPGMANRWDPVMASGMIDAMDDVTSTPYPGVITIPSFDSMSTMVPPPLLIEFPIYNMELTSMHLSEMRSCVGSRGSAAWDFTAGMGGTLSAFIRVADAKMLFLNYAGINTSLCGVVVGQLSDMTYCDTMPQSAWSVKPDSLCTGTSCMSNPMGSTSVCDPSTTCNAWHLTGLFDAQGVDID